MGDSLRVHLWGDTSCESVNSSQELYIPQVKKELIPKLHQHFDTLDEVQKFYNTYAKESGFGTRKGSSKRSKDGGTIIRKEFLCCKQGLCQRKNIDQGKESTTAQSKEPSSDSDIDNGSSKEAKTRRRNFTRANCFAKLSVVKDQSAGKGYSVIQFVEGHSHPLLSPEKIHLMRSHRQVTAVQRAFTEQLSASNVPPCQQMSILEMQYGGLENVGCTQRDLYNAYRDRRKLLDGHDANILYEHFENERQKNPGFTFTFETDDGGRLKHCFWANAISRNAYKYFGDVVVFDTTYNTNKYCLIFAPIVGVNHHRQTTLFGCAFLSDETSDTFEWFFKEWLKAMPASPPKMIITDQDPAMTKAIASTLSNTYHRYCIWHILTKFSEKIGWHKYVKHYDAFKDCIWNSRTPDEFEANSPDEFEATWASIVEEAKLSTNEWLGTMYEMRERWVPAYSRHIFAAGMTSSQRSESDHAFFKRFVSKNNSLLEFVTRFDRALAHIRHNELELDAKDVNEKPVLKTSCFMEKKMSEVYTLQIFYKFQEQLFQSNAYKGTKMDEDEHRCIWDFQRFEREGSRSRVFLVENSSDHVSCSCKMFEFEGIPCQHMLAYFSRMYVMGLPDQYILMRWSKTAKANRVMDDLGSGISEICYTPLLVKRSSLFQLASSTIDEAILNEDDTQFLEEAFESAKKEIKVRKLSRDVSQSSSFQLPIPPPVSQHGFKEPLLVRAKGYGKRLKGGKEKALKKARKCNACGLIGAKHDKRNCPTGEMLDNDVGDDDDSD